MIDWHGHVLPEIDDGSRNVQDSLAMLEKQKAQGVEVSLATPHFYANDESVENFLRRRAEAYEKLKKALPENSPEIVLGAEVRYYPGISRLEGLKSLRIEGTKLLLMEMPVEVWSESAVRELIQLAGKGSYRIILAHIERYYKLQKRSVWENLNQSGILSQSNASFFASFATKHRALSLLREGLVQLIGSDCHYFRSIQISEAYGYIQKKLGEDFFNEMNEYGYSLLAVKR
jgi:protein-tyrosine phosphatase